MAPKGAAISRRLRVSSWADPLEFMTIDKDGKPRPGVPSDPDFFNPGALKSEVFSGQPGGYRVLDDISLLQTIRDDNTAGIGIGFDRRVLSFKTDATREGFFNKVIKHCHDTLGVQCLVGFERARLDKVPGTPEPGLATWLKQPDPSPSIDDVTTRIIAFCDQHLPDYDGISFDLEGLAGSPAQLPFAIANMAAFYTTLARKLRKEPFPSGATRDRDRLVAFAAGNLIGRLPRLDGTGGDVMRSSRKLAHEPNGELSRDASNNYVSATDPLKAAFMEQAQDYDLGKADQNLIIRPMAYDNFLRTDGPQVLDDWHADIVRFMRTIKLGGPPIKIGKETFTEPVETATFQLGLKSVPGPGQEDKIDKGAIKTGMDGVMGGFSGGNRDPTTHALNPAQAASLGARIKHVRERCTNLLNPNGIGVCFFPTSPSMWKDANDALNPTMPEAGVSLGHPKQVPLSVENLAVLNKTKKPSRP
jgi:hypothetical protein